MPIDEQFVVNGRQWGLSSRLVSPPRGPTRAALKKKGRLVPFFFFLLGGPFLVVLAILGSTNFPTENLQRPGRGVNSAAPGEDRGGLSACGGTAGELTPERGGGVTARPPAFLIENKMAFCQLKGSYFMSRPRKTNREYCSPDPASLDRVHMPAGVQLCAVVCTLPAAVIRNNPLSHVHIRSSATDCASAQQLIRAMNDVSLFLWLDPRRVSAHHQSCL